jgi:hypothetical protein
VYGFQAGAPLFVKVAFSGDEVEMLNGEQTTYGLLASTKNGDEVTKWFVPWSTVSYVRQLLPNVSTPTTPVVTNPEPPIGPPTDG